MRSTLLVSAIVVITALGATIPSCRKTDARRYSLPATRSFTAPEGFPQPEYDFSGNPLTNEGFALGRKLFYEERLSLFNDVSCGGCHQQEAAFTTFDHDLGHGTNRQHTTRNVPGIFNMAWHPVLQWDGSVASLDEQVLACMKAPEKMGETAEAVINKLDDDREYADLFGKAFGDQAISGERIARALSQFVVSMVSAESRYDEVKKGRASFNASEQQGYQLFLQHCNSCHREPLFTDFNYRNNGLGLNAAHADLGRMEVTGNPDDSLKFKTPSLRNVSLTAYYAHDGRFSAVSQVLEHYRSGITESPTLDPILRNGVPLTDLEKFYLTEFLFTLADSSLVTDPAFSR